MDPLHALKDIHLPAPISWWPLALGWYVLAFILGILLCVVGYRVYRWWQKGRARRYAINALKQLRVKYQAGIATERSLDEVSQLLRRLVLAYFPREHVANLQGEAWLQFLDGCVKRACFMDGAGRLLATGPFQALKEQDLSPVFDVTQQWLRQFKPR